MAGALVAYLRHATVDPAMPDRSIPIARSVLAASAFLACGLAPARAEVRPTLRDRVDQVISTFTGDPAANVDYDLKHVLDTWRGLGPKPLETLSVADARRQPMPIEAAALLLKNHGLKLDTYDIAIKDVDFPGPGGQLTARVYTPVADPGTPADAPRPVVVFYHGGGFVLENRASTDATSRAIAGGAGVIVIAPDYSLAPERKFPAAQADALAAYKWVLGNAGSFGGDPGRVALAGEGAGAMLAADAAVAAYHDKLPEASALVLITPVAGINLKTNSWMEDSAARPWNDKAVAWAFNLFLPKPEDKYDPRVDIVGKADVRGLPPTTIVTAEVDPLRSDGERLGGKLQIATVPVAIRDYPGVTHDFFGMGMAVEKAAEAQSFVAQQLRIAFGPKGNAALALEDLGIAPYPESPGPTTSLSPAATLSTEDARGMSQQANAPRGGGSQQGGAQPGGAQGGAGDGK